MEEAFRLRLEVRSCTHALDAGLEYIRHRPMRVLPLYVLANVPFALAALFAVDEVTAGHRSGLVLAGLLLTAATLWRWAFLAVVQRRIQADITGDPPAPLRKKIFPILLVKLASSTAMTWGSLAILPAFYGFFISGFVAPLLLENPGSPYRSIRQSLDWINNSRKRLVKLTTALTLQFLVALAAVLIFQVFITNAVAASLMGFNPTGLALTLWSSSWVISLLFFLFLAFDFYWTVSAVMLFYDLQSRRLGSDLRLRLQALNGAAE